MHTEAQLWSIKQFIQAREMRSELNYPVWLSAVLRPGLIMAYLDWEKKLLESDFEPYQQAATILRSDPKIETLLRHRAVTTSLSDTIYDSVDVPWLETVLPKANIRDQLKLMGQNHPAYYGQIVDMTQPLNPDKIPEYANLWLYKILGTSCWGETYDHTDLLLTLGLAQEIDWSWFPGQIDLGIGVLQKRLNYLVLQPYASTAKYTSKFFDHLAATYEQNADVELKKQVSQGLIEQTKIAPHERVLDIACGTGFNRQFVEAKQVFGVDISLEMLQLAKRKGEQVFLGDALKLPFADKTFDVALMTFADLWVRDLRQVVSECSRVLKPGGRLGFNIHRPINGFDDWQEQYRGLLESIGFANLIYDTQTINTDKTRTYQAFFVTGTRQ